MNKLLLISLSILVLTSAPAYDKTKYISNARIAQIIRQEKARCHRCTEKELLERINARIANE